MEENRIMKAHLKSPLCLTDAERRALAEIGHRLGNKRLKEVAYLAKPDTILGCIQTRTPGVPVCLGVLPGCVVIGSAGPPIRTSGVASWRRRATRRRAYSKGCPLRYSCPVWPSPPPRLRVLGAIVRVPISSYRPRQHRFEHFLRK